MSLYLLSTLFLAFGLLCQTFHLGDVIEKDAFDENLSTSDPSASDLSTSDPSASDLSVSDFYVSELPHDVFAEALMSDNFKCAFGTVCQTFPLVLEFC